MKKYKSGLPTEEHDQISVEAYFQLVYQAVCRHGGQIIVDIGCGGGRELATFRYFTTSCHLIGIDSDPQRIKDALQKRNLDGKRIFTKVRSTEELEGTLKQRKIALIKGQLPDAPFGRKSDINLQEECGLIIANALIMFLRPAQLEAAFQTMTDMLRPQGEIFIRFSQERDDKAQEILLPDGSKDKKYFVHPIETVQNLLANSGLEVTRKPDLPDPHGRGFSWVDLHCFKLGYF